MSSESTNWVESFYDALKERVKSPYTGAYIFSWIGYNYDLFILLFFVDGTKKGLDKIEEAKRILGNSFIADLDKDFGFWGTFWIPAVAALTLMLLFPIINMAASMYSNWMKKVTRSKILKQGKKFTVSGEEYFDKLMEIQRLNDEAIAESKRVQELSNIWKKEKKESERVKDKYIMLIRAESAIKEPYQFATDGIILDHYIRGKEIGEHMEALRTFYILYGAMKGFINRDEEVLTSIIYSKWATRFETDGIFVYEIETKLTGRTGLANVVRVNVLRGTRFKKTGLALLVRMLIKEEYQEIYKRASLNDLG